MPLGHILSTTDIKLLLSKTQAIKNMHPPKTAKQLCICLGLVGYYRKFKDFAKMAKPLTLLTCHKAKFEWTPVHHTTVMSLRKLLCKHLSYVTLTQQKDTWYTWIPQMMHVEHNYHRNMIKPNSISLPIPHIH